MPVRTLVVWCPDWPVTAAGYHSDDPVAVVFANRVVACSASARAGGVQRGLRRRQAESRCAGLTVVQADPGRDARAFEPVVAAIEALTPRVEIVRPGVCAFATRGPARYFGGDDALVQRVTAAVPVPCQAGVADGPFAAELAARQGVVVEANGTPAFLAPLPVDCLERPELADLLRRLGIRTLGAFAALPPASVVARFGGDGAAAHRLARGLDERPLDARVPPPDLVANVELDPPAASVEQAAFAAKALADELQAELSSRALACTRLSIEVETEHDEHLARLWRLDQTDASAAGSGNIVGPTIAERVRWQLDGWLNGPAALRPTGGLTLLRLAPDEVVPDEGRQLGFWGGDHAADERAARAVVRVQGMLGPDAVVAPVVGGGRSPADRVQLIPWGDAPPFVATEPPWPGHVPAPSPATVHPTPVPAEVAVDEDGAPRLSIAGDRWADVDAWAGPWLLDERWWDPPAHHRAARWQMVTADGSAHLLSAEHGRWFVEATYD